MAEDAPANLTLRPRTTETMEHNETLHDTCSSSVATSTLCQRKGRALRPHHVITLYHHVTCKVGVGLGVRGQGVGGGVTRVREGAPGLGWGGLREGVGSGVRVGVPHDDMHMTP